MAFFVFCSNKSTGPEEKPYDPRRDVKTSDLFTLPKSEDGVWFIEYHCFFFSYESLTECTNSVNVYFRKNSEYDWKKPTYYISGMFVVIKDNEIVDPGYKCIINITWKPELPSQGQHWYKYII